MGWGGLLGWTQIILAKDLNKIFLWFTAAKLFFTNSKVNQGLGGQWVDIQNVNNSI